ncbi:MAG: hypothetical protein SGCHY_002093 [Lobulomycetales sp.]
MADGGRRAVGGGSSSIPTSQQEVPFSLLRQFAGPGFMVAIGYLDPGNWSTDLAAGSEFRYDLLFVIILSNIIAVMLQYLCIKLGLVTDRDLAQASRKFSNPRLNLVLYVLCELAIIACDLAEVIGTAIALNLIFGIPVTWGILLTGLDVLAILLAWDKKHFKVFELGTLVVVCLVSVCFIVLLVKADPDWIAVAWGFVPDLSRVFTKSGSLYVAMGILGATVMPHNLYLHSHIAKFRSLVDRIPASPVRTSFSAAVQPHFVDTIESGRGEYADPSSGADDSFSASASEPLITKMFSQHDMTLLEKSIFYSHIDTIVALTLALGVNSAILIVSAALFYGGGSVVADLFDAYELISGTLGPIAAFLFAFALLLSGQSSTVTGTMAGQIVMDGFLGTSFRVSPWIRRLFTRSLAIVPAMLYAVLAPDHKNVNSLLNFSSREIMTLKYVDENSGEVKEKCFANSLLVKIFAYLVAFVLTVLNLILVYQLIVEESSVTL